MVVMGVSVQQLELARYPPTGDVALWVQHGPAGPGARVNHWRGRDLARHAHAAAVSGGDCGVCGFPWWPVTA